MKASESPKTIGHYADVFYNIENSTVIYEALAVAAEHVFLRSPTFLAFP